MRWTVLVATTVMVLGLALIAPAAPAWAAACDPRLELDRAADFIDRARDIVVESETREARELLRAAATRLAEGREKLRAHRPEEACLLARAAQQLARRAVDMAQNGRAGVGEIERILARTREILEDAAVEAAGLRCPLREPTPRSRIRSAAPGGRRVSRGPVSSGAQAHPLGAHFRRPRKAAGRGTSCRGPQGRGEKSCRDRSPSR